MNATAFTHDVFLSHSSKDKPVVRELAARLKQDGVRVWLDEEQIKPGDSIPAKIEEALEHSRVLLLCMSANAFGSDWAQLESATFRFRDPLNKERRFIPLRLDDAPIKGSLAQFLYINWRLEDREQEYAKLLEACRHPVNWPRPVAGQTKDACATPHADVRPTVDDEQAKFFRRLANTRRSEWRRLQADFEVQAQKYPDLKLLIKCVGLPGVFSHPSLGKPNYMINLWQYYGAGDKARKRLASAEFTKFGISKAELSAFAVVIGKETALFCRMASRAGSLLPDDADHVVLKNVREMCSESSTGEASVVVGNMNPLAKWLNLVIMATVNSLPGRFDSAILGVDPFAASLTAFDLFLTISESSK